MPLPLSRRQVIQGAVAALAAGALPTSACAQIPLPTFTPSSPALGIVPPRGLAAVTAAVSGVGVYIGNDWSEWSETARRFALAKIRAWGFDFVCPKVGGYGRTWYRDEAHLRGWAEAAHGIGLGFVPFIYTIPDTGDADARIAAQMARVTGIACVDMEDEWGSKEKGTAPGYQGAPMASFGRVYRREAGDLPIIVTGYGDPITRFGPASAGFPSAEMAAWADAYSPQWYIGVWSRYHKGGVGAALDWGKDECRQAFGADFPICPSIDLSSIYTPDSLLPLSDTRLLMASMRSYHAPVFVWEYGQMTAGHAESLLGAPTIRNVRVGRSRKTSLSVTWDTSVPARSILTCLPLAGAAKTSRIPALELTHTGGIDGLAPGTACQLTVQASTGSGESLIVPLTVVTSPASPGVFVQSAQAMRSLQGHVVVTLLIANSADREMTDVRVVSLAVEGGTVLSPASFPYALGILGARDWQASTRDRSLLEAVIAGPPATASPLTLRVSGTSAGGAAWESVLPVVVPT